jgi:hypothetical protein
MKAMNDTLRETVAILMLLLLPVLFGTAQAGAVEYRNSYQHSVVCGQHSVVSTHPSVTVPQTMFRSTSVYPEQWSEQRTSLVNDDGSVNQEAYMSGSIGPRRSGSGSGYNPGTPDDGEENEGEQQPLGDALLPLMIFACAYLTIRATRKNIAKTIEP